MADNRVHLTSMRVPPGSLEALEASIEASSSGPALLAGRVLGLLIGVGGAIIAYAVVIWAAFGYLQDPTDGKYWFAGGIASVFAIVSTPVALQVLAFERLLRRRRD